MAIPSLEQGYLGQMQRIAADKELARKQQEFLAKQQQEQLGAELGKAALNTVLETAGNIGLSAFKNYQSEPLELAKIGAYEPEGLQVRSAALNKLKGTLGLEKPATQSVEAPQAEAPSAQPLVKALPPAAPGLQPANQEEIWQKEIDALKGSPADYKNAPSGRIQKLGEAIGEPEVKSYQDAFKPPPGPSEPSVPTSGGFDLGGYKSIRDATAGPLGGVGGATNDMADRFDRLAKLRAEAGDWNPPVDATPLGQSILSGVGRDTRDYLAQPDGSSLSLSDLSPRERGLYRASEAARGAVEASAKNDASLAAARNASLQPPTANSKEAYELRKLQAEADKAEADNNAAAAALTPGTEQYESRRTKAWSDAYAAVAKTERNVSGSSGAIGTFAGSSSANQPRAAGVVVDDGNGWPRIVAPDDQGRFIYTERGADGIIKSQTQYTVVFDDGKNKQAVALLGKNRTPSYSYLAVNGTRLDRQPDGKITTTPVEVKTEPAPANARPVTTVPTGKKPKGSKPAETKPVVSTTPVEPAATPTPTPTETKVPVPVTLADYDLPANATLADIDNAMSEDRLRLLVKKGKIKGGVDYLTYKTGLQTLKTELENAKAQTQADTAAKTARETAQNELLKTLGPIQAKFESVKEEAEKKAVENPSIGSFSRSGKFTATESGSNELLTKAQYINAINGVPAPKGMDPKKEMLYNYVKQKTPVPPGIDAQKKWLRSNLGSVRDDYRKAFGSEGDGKFYEYLRTNGIDIPEDIRPPNVQSKADDLFNRIQAQPWSADRKRAVFLATAKRDGLV